MKKISAKKPEVEGKQYHIACGEGDLSKYVLLPGDPERVLKVAKDWDSFEEIAFHREYRSVTGEYKGMEISCISTGIGSPSATIALEELSRIGCDTFLRVGSCGAIQKEIECGDLVISTGAVRLEGTSKQYVRVEYPALANHEVVLALIEASESFGFTYHLGITASTDSFYTGQARYGFKEYRQSFMKTLISDLQKAKVLNFEMEAAALFTLSNVYGLRCGAVCAVFANRVTDEFQMKGERDAGLVGSEALRILREWDEVKSKQKKRYLYPSLLR
ncbi:MAG: nucleoside phosphorylase [Candidatus Methanofastidiosia archaeon]